ncbi:MAG: YraN family protein [Dehalococcoidia bacterium]|nr:YraN family protein [Dehalococcoidia bacterium]
MNKQDLGVAGEKLACKALKKQGYRIIDQNYRCRHGEIDIIARHKEYLVFVEVRSKSSKSFGCPEESVTAQKKQILISAALDYLNSHENLPPDWRIDFVAVEFDETGKNAVRIEIIENAVC